MTALGNLSLTTVLFQLQFVIQENLREMAIVTVIDRMASCWNLNIKTKSYKYVKPPHEDQRACLDKTPWETNSWKNNYQELSRGSFPGTAFRSAVPEHSAVGVYLFCKAPKIPSVSWEWRVEMTEPFGSLISSLSKGNYAVKWLLWNTFACTWV